MSVILVLILLWSSTFGGPADSGPAYQYANCQNHLLRAYDGPDGYVRWGQPTQGAWTDRPLPLVGKARLLSLVDCRVLVRNWQNFVLYLNFNGTVWSLPYVGYSAYLPLVGR